MTTDHYTLTRTTSDGTTDVTEKHWTETTNNTRLSYLFEPFHYAMNPASQITVTYEAGDVDTWTWGGYSHDPIYDGPIEGEA